MHGPWRKLWIRLQRLWHQDRIRLSAADSVRPALERGDRLEVDGRIFRLLRPAGGGGFVALDETHDRSLVVHPIDGTSYRFEFDDGVFELPALRIPSGTTAPRHK